MTDRLATTRLSRLQLKLLALLVGLVLLFAALVLYVQSRHGFRHLIVPLVNALLPGELTVRDGAVSLSGTLQAEGLSYRNGELHGTIEAERLLATVSVPSFFGGRAPVISNLEIEGVRAAFSAPNHDEEDAGAEALSKGAAVGIVIPVIVQQARLDDVSVVVRSEESFTTMRDVRARIAGLQPGRRGTITLSAGWSAGSFDAHSGGSWAGTAALAVNLDLDPEGMPLAWAGTNTVVIEEWPGRSDAKPSAPIRVEQSISGGYGEGRITVVSTVVARQAEASLGTATLEASLSGEAPHTLRDASLTLEGLEAGALNVWLATAPARFASARLDGHLKVETKGERSSVHAKLDGQALQLWLVAEKRVTPPLEIHLEHVGTVDQQAGLITIEALSLAIADRRRTLVQGTLDQPVRLPLHAGAGAGTGEGTTPPSVWTLTINDVGVQELQPWAALGGSDVLAGVQAGTLRGQLRVAVRQQAETVELHGRLQAARLVIGGGDPAKRVGPLTVTSDVRATLAGLETVHLDPWVTTVSLGDAVVGTLRAAGTARVRPRVELHTLGGELMLAQLPGEALNPVLAQTGPTRIVRARLSGRSTVQLRHDQMVWEVNLQGQQMSLRLGEGGAPTPALDVRVEQNGTYDRASSVAQLGVLNIEVIERRRAVLAMTLDRPMTLDLKRMTTAGESGPAPESEPIHLTLEARRLSLPQLRPWLALAGAGGLQSVEQGILDGSVQVEVRGQGEAVSVAGRVGATDMRVRHADGTRSRPLSVDSRLEVTLARASRVHISSWETSLSSGTKALARARLSGSTDVDTGAVDLVATTTSSDLMHVLATVGVLSARQQELARKGDLSASIKVATAGGPEALVLTAEARARNLEVMVGPGHVLTQTVTATGRIEVDRPRTLARLQEVSLSVEREGAPAGSLTVAGQWPLDGDRPPAMGRASSPRVGELVMRAHDLDVGLLVDVLDLLPGRAPGPLPVSADLTIAYKAVGRVLTVKGRETVGPLRLAARDGRDATPVTLHLEHEIVRDGDELRVTTFDLTSERPGGEGDEVTLDGAMQVGLQPSARLRGAVRSLDAGWYADLLVGVGEGTSPSPARERSESPERAGEPAFLGLPMDLDVEARIGSVRFRTVTLSRGRLIATGQRGRWIVTLEPTELAGGTVEAGLTVVLENGQPAVSWTAEGQALDLGALLQALRPEGEPPITGQAAFTTSGDGRGHGEALKQSMKGTAVVEVTEGRLVKSDLLQFIAEQTRVKQFESFGFRTVKGELRLEEGWIHLAPLRVMGLGLALEATGKVGLDGRLDARVIPKVGGVIAEQVQRLCFAPLLATVGDLTVFPFAISISGTVEKPSYGVAMTVIESVQKSVTQLPARVLSSLKDCANLPKAGKELVEGVFGAIKGAAGGILGQVLGSEQKE